MWCCKKIRATIAAIVIAFFSKGVVKKKKVMAVTSVIAFFYDGFVNKKVTIVATIVAFFFAFLCGGVAMMKVVLAYSLCLRRRRRQ